MRLSRKVGLVIAFIAIAAVLGWMGSTYLETTAEYNALQDRHETAQARLPGLIAEKTELENEESRAKAMLDTSKSKFPATIESIEYDEDLCRTAMESNVQIVRITASPPGTTRMGDIDYSISSFVVVVRGETRNILGFVHALRTGRDFQLPWSTRIKEVTINYQSGEALIGLDIYGYKR